MCLGLPFIPLSLFLAFNFRTAWSYLVLFIFVSFLLAIHTPTAIGLTIILIPYILLNLKGNFKHSLMTGLVLAIPFLAPFPWIFKKLGPTAQSLLTPQPFPTKETMRAYAFLRGGCDDTSFLEDNGISLVYTPGACNNPDLVKVRKRVYLLKEDGGK